MTATPLIEAQDLLRSYTMRRGLFGRPVEVRAVDGVSLHINKGETLGLVGESGCGKSSTARLVLGVDAPNGGRVAFEGNSMPSAGTRDWARLRKRMQMVYQDPLAALDKRLTIGTQIAEPLDIHRIGTKNERRDRVTRVMAEVGLQPHHAGRSPHSLSGGQRQRAVIARALVTDPDLLVCDEPISALDVSIQALVLNLLMELQERKGMGMLFVSHDLRAVRQISHRMAVMYLGRIVEEGDPDAVLQDPAHPYSQALVSAIPHPGKTAQRVILQGDPPNPANRPSGCAFHPRCPVASSLCRAEAPVLKARSSDGRRVACHVAHGEIVAGRGQTMLEAC